MDYAEEITWNVLIVTVAGFLRGSHLTFHNKDTETCRSPLTLLLGAELFILTGPDPRSPYLDRVAVSLLVLFLPQLQLQPLAPYSLKAIPPS